MAAFSFRSVARFAVTASTAVAAFGAGVAYKAIGYAKRRLADLASKPRLDGGGSDGGGDGGVTRQRSVADELRLPGAREAAPAVRVQMIRNWTEAFAEAHVDPMTTRIRRALGRLDRLDRESRRLRTAAGFETAELARIRRKLQQCRPGGVGLVSAATQTPPPPPPPPAPAPQSVSVQPSLHVRFALPLPRPWREIISNESIPPPCEHSCVNTPLSYYFTYVLSAFKMFIDFLANPILLQMIATEIVQWSKQLLSINIVVDLAQDKTMMEFHVLPFIPRRFFD